MGIRQRNSGTSGNATAGSFNATLPQAALATSRIVVAVTSNTVWNTPANWASRSPQVATMGQYIFDGPSGSTNSWAFTNTAVGHFTWHCWEVEAGAFDVSAGLTSSPTATLTWSPMPSVTPTAGERVILAQAGLSSTVTTSTIDAWANSFVEVHENQTQSGEFVRAAFADKALTADGTTAQTSSLTFSATMANVQGSAIFAAYSTATPAATTLPFTAITASGWTPTGGTAQAVLADASDATYVTSPTNPSGSVVDLTMTPIETPAGDLVATIRADRLDAASASIVATLRDGGTTVATAATVNPGTTAGDLTVTFPAANISGVTQAKWRSGTLVIRLAVTAA